MTDSQKATISLHKGNLPAKSAVKDFFPTGARTARVRTALMQSSALGFIPTPKNVGRVIRIERTAA